MTILLTPEQEATIKSTYSYIQLPDGGNWYYSPYYLRALGNGSYEQVCFNELPENVKDTVLANQGLKLPA